MPVSITLTGVKELDEALRLMPAELSDKTLQSAGLAAARPLVEKAKQLAPKGKTKNVSNSIGAYRGGNFKSVVSGKRQIGAVSAGPRRGRYKGFAAHLNEYGTVVRFSRKRNGRPMVKPANRGKMTAKPFMEPAFEQTKPQILGTYNTILSKRIVGVMKRTLKNR